MSAPRHKGQRRPSTTARWLRRLSVPAAVLGVVAAGGLGFLVAPDHDPSVASQTPSGHRSLGQATVEPRDERARISRSVQRPISHQPPGESGLATMAVPDVTGHDWAAADLNLWSGPGEDSDLVGEIPAGTRLATTGIVEDGWAQVIVDGMPRWVNASYVSQDDPDATSAADPAQVSTKQASIPDRTGSVSFAPCPSGDAVESGLTEDAVRVHRAVCAAFPQITSYGGVRPGDSGEHGTGQALDIMVSDQGLGDQIASYLIAHRSQLGVSEVLWWQQIWTVERSSEGWRAFSDRGSPTANHYDHVHVTVYGDAGR